MQSSSLLVAALEYAKRGIAVTPVHFRTKIPVPDWHLRTLKPDEFAAAFRGDSNIGIILGWKSGGLVDVDLDDQVAIRLAPHFLPETSARFGRESKRNSHWLYLSDLHATEDKAALQCSDPATGEMLLELRLGAGDSAAQTVAPPSQHESGENIEWEPGCEISRIAVVNGADLKWRFMKLSAAVLLLPYWQEGARNGAANAIAGWLARNDLSVEEASQFVTAIAEVAGDNEVKMRIRAVRDTYKKYEAGKKVTGLPRLRELFGDAVDKAAEWLSTDSKEFPDRTKHGQLRGTLPNTKVALKLLEVECKHDLFKLSYVIDGHTIESYVGEVSDPALLRIRELIHEKFRFDPTTQIVDTAVRTLANHHRYHPVCDYLDSLTWDGEPRIDRWLIKYGGAEDTAYTQAVGALVLVAAVRRVRDPGCKFDEMLVLENPDQGTNKSQALQTLAVKPEWFTDNLPLGASGKEIIEILSGHWIVEAGELQGMRKSDAEKIKAFLSRNTDRARMAYDRTVTSARRQCVIIGTTNSKQYLRDLTGNRRFWPVRVGRFDVAGLERDRDQLWAEAAAREASGVSIRLPEELWPVAASEQQKRQIENPFTSVLDSVLREHDELVEGEWVQGKAMEGKIIIEDVWTILQLLPKQRTQQHFEWLGQAMKELGWQRTRLRSAGRHSYFYVRGRQPYRLITVTLNPGEGGVPPSPVAGYFGERPKF